MISISLFVNITILILLVVFFRKFISRFIDAHVSNEPLLFGSRSLRATSSDLVISSSILENSKRSRKVTYNCWLHLDNVGKSRGDISNKVIFNHNNNFSVVYAAKDSELNFLIGNKKYPQCEILVQQQKWFNLNIGFDGTIMDIYIDGELKKTVRLSVVPPIPNGKMTIVCKKCSQKAGTPNSKSGVYGDIDIFRYYNKYIEPDRVKEMYESSKPEKNNKPSDNAFWWM